MPNYKANYVVLTHDWPELHWDLMLEEQAALRTFRLSQPPDHPGPIAAEPLPDHRKAYLDYEGPVSGERGNVTRWDRGEYELLAGAGDRIEVALRGGRLAGRAVLERHGDGNWSFTCRPE